MEGDPSALATAIHVGEPDEVQPGAALRAVGHLGSEPATDDFSNSSYQIHNFGGNFIFYAFMMYVCIFRKRRNTFLLCVSHPACGYVAVT